MKKANKLFEKTYHLCQKWHCRKFTLHEKRIDVTSEASELIEAIIKRKTKEEIGLEYGDVLFTLIRHYLGEKPKWYRKWLFMVLPQKYWLEKKLEILDQRHDWWLENYDMHSIRNYKNKKKRQQIVDRHNGLIPKNTWIK